MTEFGKLVTCRPDVESLELIQLASSMLTALLKRRPTFRVHTG